MDPKCLGQSANSVTGKSCVTGRDHCRSHLPAVSFSGVPSAGSIGSIDSTSVVILLNRATTPVGGPSKHQPGCYPQRTARSQRRPDLPARSRQPPSVVGSAWRNSIAATATAKNAAEIELERLATVSL